MTIQLLLVDDHAFVREAVRAVLAETEIVVVAEADNGRSGFAVLRQHAVDVALVDLQMPEADGFQFLRLVREAGLELPVVMHSSWDRAEYWEACRELGARGFVVKGCETDTLVSAVRSAVSVTAGRDRNCGGAGLPRPFELAHCEA